MTPISETSVSFCFNPTCQKQLDKKMVCSVCKIATYCSRECQKLDWKVHKKSCAQTPTEKKTEVAVSSILPTTSPLVTLENALRQKQEEWNQYAPNTDKMWRAWIKTTSKKFFQDFYNRGPLKTLKASLQNAKHIVDLGAGVGDATMYLAKQLRKKVTAVDSSQSCINYINKVCPKPLVSVVKADLLEYNIPQDADFILALRVFEYCPPNRLLEILQKICDALPLGGYFLFSLPITAEICPNQRVQQWTFMGRSERGYEHLGWVVYFLEEELCFKMQENLTVDLNCTHQAFFFVQKVSPKARPFQERYEKK